MSYQTGTSTGPDDLLDKLRLFLIADGWSVNSYTSDGTGDRLHVQKSPGTGLTTMYFNFRSATDEYGATITEDNTNGVNGAVTGIIVNGSTGYNGGNDWDKQPGYALNIAQGGDSFGMCISPVSVTAIPSYHFFSENNTVNIVVEITSGIFQFMSFGMLDKEGVYTGGMFFTASYQTLDPYYEYTNSSAWYVPHYLSGLVAGDVHGAVYVDADSTADWRVAEASSSPEIMFPAVASQRANAVFSQAQIASHFWEKSPNFYNNIPAFCPAYVFLERSDSNYTLLGEPAGVRVLNVLNYDPADVITYGGDEWLVFPADSVADVADVLNVNTGFAFKKVS